jgi:hypothetical protein
MGTPSLYTRRADHRRGVSKSETTGQATRQIAMRARRSFMACPRCCLPLPGVRELGLISALLGTLSNMQCDLTHE